MVSDVVVGVVLCLNFILVCLGLFIAGYTIYKSFKDGK